MMGQMKVGKFGSDSIFCITGPVLAFEKNFRSLFFGNTWVFQKFRPFSWTKASSNRQICLHGGSWQWRKFAHKTSSKFYLVANENSSLIYQFYFVADENTRRWFTGSNFQLSVSLNQQLPYCFSSPWAICSDFWARISKIV